MKFKDFISESHFKKGQKVKVVNAKSYDSLAKSSEVHGEIAGTSMTVKGVEYYPVKVGSGSYNVEAKDLMLNEQFNESPKYRNIMKTQDGETLKSGVFDTKKKADDHHWKMTQAKDKRGNRIYKSIETIEEDSENVNEALGPEQCMKELSDLQVMLKDLSDMKDDLMELPNSKKKSLANHANAISKILMKV